MEINIVLDMSTFKKAKVVMLSTKEKATIGDLGLSINVLNFAKNNDWINIYKPIKQNIYIISDDEIKEGDWCINTGGKIKESFPFRVTKEVMGNKFIKKIIATTDASLGLPQPSQQFIEEYIEEYNKGNIITDVLVEYENKFDGKEYVDELDAYGYDIIKSILKINPKDNTITIKKVKDSYTIEEVDRMLDEQASKTTAEMLEKFKDYKSKEEVIDLIMRAVGESHDWSREHNDIHSINIIEKRFLNQWIEENL